jgi:hypothetical protein
MNRDASRQALGVVAVLPWLATRLGWFGSGAPAANGLIVEGRLWPFFFVDHNALWLLLAGVIWLLYEPSKRSAWVIVALLTLSNAWVYATESLVRYYAGFASAYDLANYIQPLWRASAGQSMAGTWLGDMPIWADHGSFALVFFVPFVRLFSDAGSGVLLAQAVLAAAWIPAVFALARAVGLPTSIALLVTCVAAASRAIFHAVGYDTPSARCRCCSSQRSPPTNAAGSSPRLAASCWPRCSRTWLRSPSAWRCCISPSRVETGAASRFRRWRSASRWPTCSPCRG